jgi:hypothetical protein
LFSSSVIHACLPNSSPHSSHFESRCEMKTLISFEFLFYIGLRLHFSAHHFSSQFAQDYIRKQPPTSKNNLVTTAWFYQADASVVRRRT